MELVIFSEEATPWTAGGEERGREWEKVVQGKMKMKEGFKIRGRVRIQRPEEERGREGSGKGSRRVTN